VALGQEVVSAITQDAIRMVLSARSAAVWLDSPDSLEARGRVERHRKTGT